MGDVLNNRMCFWKKCILYKYFLLKVIIKQKSLEVLKKICTFVDECQFLVKKH